MAHTSSVSGLSQSLYQLIHSAVSGGLAAEHHTAVTIINEARFLGDTTTTIAIILLAGTHTHW